MASVNDPGQARVEFKGSGIKTMREGTRNRDSGLQDSDWYLTNSAKHCLTCPGLLLRRVSTCQGGSPSHLQGTVQALLRATASKK